MSSFDVTPAAVGDVGGRLESIPGEIGTLLSGVGSCSGAAASTRLNGALEELVGAWGRTLPALALVSGHVSVALRAAAANYSATDTGIGQECGGR